MRVRYKGHGSLRFNSAPSRFPYLFDAGVYQAVKPEDEQFFKNKAAIPGNDWEVETVAEKVESAVDSVTKRIIRKNNRKGGDE